MTEGRIFFPGNPWPEGHPIKEFRWWAHPRGSDVWFGFHLETADYDSERQIDENENVENPSDWSAPDGWYNFHHCTISADFWHDGGFLACSLADFSPEHVDGLRVQVDPLPRNLQASDDEPAFHIYLLGHDSVVDQRIAFFRDPVTNRFNIEWEGKIALTYVGDYEPKHHFRAQLRGVQLPDLAPAP